MNWITLVARGQGSSSSFYFLKITFQLCVSLCPDDLNSEAHGTFLAPHVHDVALFPFLLSKLSTTVICMARGLRKPL
jgi:hypothetical protein